MKLSNWTWSNNNFETFSSNYFLQGPKFSLLCWCWHFHYQVHMCPKANNTNKLLHHCFKKINNYTRIHHFFTCLKTFVIIHRLLHCPLWRVSIFWKYFERELNLLFCPFDIVSCKAIYTSRHDLQEHRASAIQTCQEREWHGHNSIHRKYISPERRRTLSLAIYSVFCQKGRFTSLISTKWLNEIKQP